MATSVIDGVEEKIYITDDLTPEGIIDSLGLREPQYLETAKWGHFGHKQFNWEEDKE